MEQELHTLPEHVSSPSVFGGICFTQLVFCVIFCQLLFVHLSVVLSVFLQFMTSDYPFDIFKLVFILNKAVYLDILSSNNCIVYFMVFRSLKKKSGCSYNRSLKYKYNFTVF